MTIKKRKGKVTNFELFLGRVPKAFWVILQSVVLAIFWEKFVKLPLPLVSEGANDFGALFVSITLSMIIWKLGFHKLLLKRTSK